MNKIVGIFFAISYLATSAISSSVVGVGHLFWVIIATGIAVGTSQFVPALSEVGGKTASLLSTLSVCAVILHCLQQQSEARSS